MSWFQLSLNGILMKLLGNRKAKAMRSVSNLKQVIIIICMPVRPFGVKANEAFLTKDLLQ